MNALRLIEWRRWIATLCVVLVAFVMVERTVAADPCHGGASAVSYNIALTASVTDGDVDRSDGQSSLPAQQQHCCSAHIAGMPPAPLANAAAPMAVKVQSLFANARAPNGEQSGQDRPPRNFAIV